MAATKLLEKENSNAREGEHSLNNPIDGVIGTNNSTHGMQSSSSQDTPSKEEERNEPARLNPVGQARQEHKLGVSFAPILSCSTPKTINQVDPTLNTGCVAHNVQGRETSYVQ